MSYSASGQEQDSRFRDLLERLTEHAWLAFLYVLGLILFVYVFGWYSVPSVLFAGFELPTYLAVLYVLSRNPLFRLHVGFLWPATAAMIWSYLARDDGGQSSVAKETLPLSIAAITIYWLVRAVVRSRKDFSQVHSSLSFPYAIASLLSIWGAFLQVAVLVLLPVKYLVPREMEQSSIGALLVGILEVIRLSSPLAWFPVGLLLLGWALFTVLGLQKVPYVARDYKDVLRIEVAPTVDPILAFARLPIWICVVIVEFLKHVVAIAWENIRTFMELWFERLCLVLFGMVLPFVFLALGHVLVFQGVSLGTHLSTRPSGLWEVMLLVGGAIVVHGMVVFALAAFVVSIAPIGIRVGELGGGNLYHEIRLYLFSEGLPAAQAVGKTFVLFALVALAVPVAALIPGGSGWGVFSSLYSLLLIALGTSYALWDRLSEDEKKEKQQRLQEWLKELKLQKLWRRPRATDGLG